MSSRQSTPGQLLNLQQARWDNIQHTWQGRLNRTLFLDGKADRTPEEQHELEALLEIFDYDPRG